MTAAEWVVTWCHSRNLYRGRPFVNMPYWVDDVRDRAKRGIQPTEDELAACVRFVLVNWDRPP